MPPLRMDVLNIGCAACHAGPTYGADGIADVTKAVPGMPNTSLDLETFTATAYAALKRALADEPGLMAAIERLFPRMGLREKLTLRWLAIRAGAMRSPGCGRASTGRCRSPMACRDRPTASRR